MLLLLLVEWHVRQSKCHVCVTTNSLNFTINDVMKCLKVPAPESTLLCVAVFDNEHVLVFYSEIQHAGLHSALQIQ